MTNGKSQTTEDARHNWYRAGLTEGIVAGFLFGVTFAAFVWRIAQWAS